MGEKTEEATPKKLRDARKKGQVAKSQDFPSAFTFVASIAVVLGSTAFLYSVLGGLLIQTFKEVDKPDLIPTITAFWGESYVTMLIASLPVLVVTSIIGCLITFLSVGPTWAPEVFKFDIKKFDPIQNLKSKFKMKTLVEILKQIAKITVAGYIVYLVMVDAMVVMPYLIKQPVIEGLSIFYTFLVQVIFKVGMFFVAVAVVDFIYQKRTFAKEMRMEKFETKQEYKNTEGDPHIKGKRKQIGQEIAYGDGGPGPGVKQAQAVVTNPTHLAIAIGYERKVDPAPYVLAMGEGLQAEQIIKFAELYDVPIVRNIPLAHVLYEQGNLYEYIPEDTYTAMAEILRWVESLDPNGESAYKEVDL